MGAWRTDMPRSATVRAVTDVEVLLLGRAAFTRLVGKCSRIIERNKQLYDEMNAQLAETELSVAKLIEAPPVVATAGATAEADSDGQSERKFEF